RIGTCATANRASAPKPIKTSRACRCQRKTRSMAPRVLSWNTGLSSPGNLNLVTPYLPSHPRRVDLLDPKPIRRAIELALAEDIGSGDVTTLATVPEAATATAVMRAREPVVLAGVAFAEAAFRELSS